MATVAEQLQGFIAKVNEELAREFAKSCPQLTVPTVEAMEGPKHYRIVKTAPGSRYAYCFIDKSTGAILKSASWKAPAKGIRGSIFDPNFGWGKAVNEHGAAYFVR